MKVGIAIYEGEAVRYACDHEGTMRHADYARYTSGGYRCVACSAHMEVAMSRYGSAVFQHPALPDCTGRLPCEQAPDVIAELGSKTRWISFDANWREGNWIVETVRLTWSGEGYLPDAVAVNGSRKILLTGRHEIDPSAALDSIWELFGDTRRRLANAAGYSESFGHAMVPGA